MLMMATPAETTRGKALFDVRCGACHGKEGRGDGVVASAIRPKPADLSVARFSADRLHQVIREGVQGTAMPAQPDLLLADRQAIVTYVQSLGPTQAPIGAQAAARSAGANTFAIRCASCHGESGDGLGPASRRVGRPPTDFTGKQPTRERIVEVLENGIPGTAMTPMRRLLSEDEVAGLVAFVQCLFGENRQAGIRSECDR
jgi:mono/diheme cytochrome c family protein